MSDFADWNINILIIPVGAIARSSAYYGQGTGPILYDNVACLGNERVLQACTHLTIDNCGHYEDSGVSCRPAGENYYYTVISTLSQCTVHTENCTNGHNCQLLSVYMPEVHVHCLSMLYAALDIVIQYWTSSLSIVGRTSRAIAPTGIMSIFIFQSAKSLTYSGIA